MQLKEIRLLVDDFFACRDFYRDVLGLKLTLETESNSYAQFIDGEVYLGLYRREMMANVVGPTAEDNARAAKDTALIAFEVEDVDAAVVELEARGAQFVREAHDQPEWFMRVAHLRDPDGNLVELFHSLPTEAG